MVQWWRTPCLSFGTTVRFALWWHAPHKRCGGCSLHLYRCREVGVCRQNCTMRAILAGAPLHGVWVVVLHNTTLLICSKMHRAKPCVRDGSGGRTSGATSSRVPPLLSCYYNVRCVTIRCVAPAEPIATHSPPVPFQCVCCRRYESCRAQRRAGVVV